MRSDSGPTLPGEVVPEDINDANPADIVMDSKDKREKERGHSEDTESNDDVLWVNWDGPNDPLNPKNWSYKKKWAATIIVSSFTFISPVSSSMVAPATEQVAQRFGINSSVLIAMTTSVFVLGYAVGPLFLGPLSEIYGRSRVLQLSNLFYLVWNIACGFAQNKNELIVFRLLAGLGGSAPLSIGGGVLGDIWHAEERGRAIAIYSLAPLLGPVVGPVCGGWIAERSTWRWVFWSTSIVDVLVQISGLFFLRETFAPYLLEQKAKEIRQKLDEENAPHREVRTIFESAEPRSWQHIFAKALTRPFQLFAYETIVQILGVYMAFVYGIFYLFLTTMPVIFRDNYHEGPGIGGLHYIALGIGLSASSQVNARFMDRIYIHFKKRNNGVGEPEFRLPTTIPGSIILPFGLLLSGWAAQHKLHWIAVDFGIACVGAGMILVFQGIQTYVVDTFTLHAASALAAVSTLRSLAGFGFPLFAPSMYAKLGYGKGNTILAALAIALGCPAPILLWKFGKRIRMSSRYANKQAHPRSPPISAGPTLEASHNDHHNEKKNAITLLNDSFEADALSSMPGSAEKGAQDSIRGSGSVPEGQVRSNSEKRRAERVCNGDKAITDSEVLLVDWDGPSDPSNPKNWPYRKKWVATLVVSSFTFISPVSSSMVAPASDQVAQNFGITSNVLIAMTTSVFLLGYAAGPLFIGPLSEIFGRTRVLQSSYLFYLAWNTGCGFSTSKTQLLIFRFLAGLGGGAPLAIGGGVLGDIWLPEERGKAIAVYSLAPLLGPAIGPVCGGWIAERSTWRWVFWSTSLADVVVQITGLFYLRESYAPFLLEQKANQIRKRFDLETRPHKIVRTVFESSEERTWKNIFRKALTRPFRLFAYESIVQILGLYMAFVYGIFYIFLTSAPIIFSGIYNEGPGAGGLHYIALGLGLWLSSQASARYIDRIYIYFKNKNNGVGEPEFRLPTIILGSMLVPFGLLLSGWSAQKKIHWIAVDIKIWKGNLFVGAGSNLVFQGVQTYVVDTFTLHAASALAAVNTLRSLAGFGFPLFSPAMLPSSDSPMEVWKKNKNGKQIRSQSEAPTTAVGKLNDRFYCQSQQQPYQERVIKNFVVSESNQTAMEPLAYSATGSSAAQESTSESESDTLSVHTGSTSTAAGESVHRRPEAQHKPQAIVRPSSMLLDDIDGFSEEELEQFVTRERTMEHGESGKDTLWVDWDGPNDKADPKHWSYKKKWSSTLVVSSFTFISPVASSMVAPATEQIAAEFGIRSTPLLAMTISVFILGYAVGPLFLGPLSEIYGRSRVLQLANLFFFAWNLGCGFAQNRSQLIAFRFMSGIGGSAPLSVGGGVLGDMWAPEERGRAIAIYSLAPLLGPVVGPICGGWIAERTTWRWVFWSTSIADAVIQAIGLIYLRETYAPLLLDRKASEMCKNLDLEKSPYKEVRTVYDLNNDRSWKAIFRKALTRPFLLFVKEPIIQVIGIYMAFVYGIFYLFLTTMPLIFTEVYRERPGIAGLNYIALGVGLTLTSQINARVLDRVYKHFKTKNGGVGEPEFRLPSLFPGTILLPFGLFLTGWSSQQRLHWIATDVVSDFSYSSFFRGEFLKFEKGIACVGSGMVLVFQSMQTYVIDSFTLYAASALAAVSFLRSLAGFGFPLFAPAMYHKLGYGKGDTILACLAIGLGCPAPFLLWIYGKRIRMSSEYARKSQSRQQNMAKASAAAARVMRRNSDEQTRPPAR
ncbi:hypothetical protein CVT25_011866 [Psilocybe cyanescens]|uniref:Major facilitator superfamily (MFS) profile domain-containing protein n=1 Tax=Psilocybe cyanescens TaxID=93625 RepID=A0A409WJ25_PSICY|nr:hypothetical protein CVT25_011866 [Psilocybe cyanescens]